MRFAPIAPLLTLLLLAPSCQTFGAFPDPAWALRGNWSSTAQYEEADPQHVTFRSVEAPALAGAGGTAVHLVWRSGGADGPISRQRLWVFRPNARTGRPQMHVHALLNPEPFATATADSPLFRTLTSRDVTSYPDECALPVRVTRSGFRARMPEGCDVTAHSGRSMTLPAEIRLEGRRLTYSKAGIPPNPGPYLFERQ
jgi:hypothetical protein